MNPDYRRTIMCSAAKKLLLKLFRTLYPPPYCNTSLTMRSLTEYEYLDEHVGSVEALHTSSQHRVNNIYCQKWRQGKHVSCYIITIWQCLDHEHDVEGSHRISEIY